MARPLFILVVCLTILASLPGWAESPDPVNFIGTNADGSLVLNAPANIRSIPGTASAGSRRTREFWRVLTGLNDRPDQLLADSCLSNGPMHGAVTLIPQRYARPNYVINWYFANVGLYYLVPDHQGMIRDYLDAYVAHLQADDTIRDVDLRGDRQTIWQTYAADSDDAYAGTFLRLAERFRETYPDDPWFTNHLGVLKAVAKQNLVLQIKPNGLVQVFQQGLAARQSARQADGARQLRNRTGYLMDNIQAWAGLAALVRGLSAVHDDPGEIQYFAAGRDRIQTAISKELWDAKTGAWKASDDPAQRTARHDHYYPDLMCQYYPELYDWTDPEGGAETQRRYRSAWSWLETHRSNWWHPSAWTMAGVVNASDLSLALVAWRHGESTQVRCYLALAVRDWLPNASTPRSTIISEVGCWQAVLDQMDGDHPQIH